MIKTLRACFLLLFLLIPIGVCAEEGYIIDEYNIDIVVNKNNSFDITERIYVDFLEKRHGIIRTLPLMNEVVREDGTISKNKAKLSDVSSNMKYETTKYKNNYEIKIGSQDEYLSGTAEIVIKYNYAIGNDPVKGKDEVYYNIIGTDWGVPIETVNFRIQFPDNKIEDIGFSYGFYGETQYNDVKWEYEDSKTITGKLETELLPGQALTIRATLPDGYFSKSLDIKSLICITALLLIGIWSVAIFIKDEHKLVDTVEFYPPENMNGLDCKALLSLSLSKEDAAVMSLLFTLANKGYIEIEDKKIGYIIRKLKEYDGYNDEEEMFMKGLFVGDEKEITSEDIRNYFYPTIKGIVAVKIEKLKKCFKKINYKVIIYAIFLCLVWILFSVGCTLQINYPLIVVILLFHVIIYFINKNNEGIWMIIGDLLIYSVLFIMVCIGMVNNLYPVTTTIIIAVISLILILMIIYFSSKLNRLTNKHFDLRGRIKGFKNFLVTAKKDELETLVEGNPNYFYDILPYTMALGVSHVWVSKFKEIGRPDVIWYKGDDIEKTKDKYEDDVKQSHKINRTHSTYSSYSSSSSNSNRSRSNGGFAGGGSGGGGGRSW